MDEFEDAARDIGQGIRNLRDLIDAERERQENVANDRGTAGEAQVGESQRSAGDASL